MSLPRYGYTQFHAPETLLTPHPQLQKHIPHPRRDPSSQEDTRCVPKRR